MITCTVYNRSSYKITDIIHFIAGLWKPQFKTEDGKDTTLKYHQFVHGLPDCETTQPRPIIVLGNPESEDE